MRAIGGAPDVTGLTATDAEAVLGKAGFRMEVDATALAPSSRQRESQQATGANPVVHRVVRQRVPEDGVVRVTCVLQTAFLQL